MSRGVLGGLRRGELAALRREDVEPDVPRRRASCGPREYCGHPGPLRPPHAGAEEEAGDLLDACLARAAVGAPAREVVGV